MTRVQRSLPAVMSALAALALAACAWRTLAAGPETGSWLAIAALVANLLLLRAPAAGRRLALPAARDPGPALLARAAFVEAGGGLARRGRGAAMVLIALEAEADAPAAADIVRRALPGGAAAGRLDERTIAFAIQAGQPYMVDALAEHLHGALAQAAVAGRGIPAAIGIADIERDDTVPRAVARARVAAAAARHRPRRYDTTLDAAARAHADAAAALAASVASGRFAALYRPRREAGSDRPAGFAVTAADDAGDAAPAERTAALMRHAFAEARDWSATLSFALEPAELADPWLAHKIVKQLVESGFPARRLEVTAPAHAIGATAQATLLSLSNQGVRIALIGIGGPGLLIEVAAAIGADRLEADPAIAARPALVDALAGIGLRVAAPDQAAAIGVGAARRLLAEHGLLPAARAPAPPLRRAG